MLYFITIKQGLMWGITPGLQKLLFILLSHNFINFFIKGLVIE